MWKRGEKVGERDKGNAQLLTFNVDRSTSDLDQHTAMVQVGCGEACLSGLEIGIAASWRVITSPLIRLLCVFSKKHLSDLQYTPSQHNGKRGTVPGQMHVVVIGSKSAPDLL